MSKKLTFTTHFSGQILGNILRDTEDNHEASNSELPAEFTSVVNSFDSGFSNDDHNQFSGGFITDIVTSQVSSMVSQSTSSSADSIAATNSLNGNDTQSTRAQKDSGTVQPELLNPIPKKNLGILKKQSKEMKAMHLDLMESNTNILINVGIIFEQSRELFVINFFFRVSLFLEGKYRIENHVISHGLRRKPDIEKYLRLLIKRTWKDEEMIGHNRSGRGRKKMKKANDEKLNHFVDSSKNYKKSA